MRIGIDLFSLVPGMGRGGGFHRYATSLVQGLFELEDDHQYILFVNRLGGDFFPSGKRFTKVVVSLPPRRKVWPFRILWQQVLLPTYIRRLRLDTIHFPFDTATFFPGVRYVVTIHDLIADTFYPVHFPGSISRAKSTYLFRAKRSAAARAAAVICPSRATAEGVVRHYDVPEEKITVIPEAPGNRYLAVGDTTASPINTDRPYALSVVSLSPHKNIEILVQAFARARTLYGLPHELRIVGMPGTSGRRIGRYLSNGVPNDVRVHYLGFVEESTLAAMYRDASLLVYIPWVEGFGLPPLEAMAVGLPVVASNVSSLPEVCGDAALLVPPGDVDAVAHAIGRVLTDSTVAQRLSEAGRCHAKGFSWSKAAVETRAIYERIAGRVGLLR